MICEIQSNDGFTGAIFDTDAIPRRNDIILFSSPDNEGARRKYKVLEVIHVVGQARTGYGLVYASTMIQLEVERV